MWLLLLAPAGLGATPPLSPEDEAQVREFLANPPAVRRAMLSGARAKATDKPAAAGKPAAASPPAAEPKPAAAAAPAGGAATVPNPVPDKPPASGKPGAGAKAVQTATINSWLEHNIQVRNSFYDTKEVESPAKISWNKNANEAAFYNVDVAVAGIMFTQHPKPFPVGDEDITVAPMPVFEAHVSNEANTRTSEKSQDSLLFALPILIGYQARLDEADFNDWMNGRVENVDGSGHKSSDWIMGGQFILNPAYRMDRENDVKATEAGLYWRPGVWYPLGLNRTVEIIPHAVSFRWDPLIGFEGGHYEGRGSHFVKLPEDYVRGFARLHAEIGLGPLEQTPVTITADYTIRHEFLTVSNDYNYSEISVVDNLDAGRLEPVADAYNQPKKDSKTGKAQEVFIPGHLKLGVTWKRGKDAPTFKDVDTFSAWIGLQY